MNANHSTLGPSRRPETGATIAAAVCLLLASAPMAAPACDPPPYQGYYERDSRTVDAVAASLTIMPAVGAAGLCGMLVLPADVYWKVKRPEDAFGAHAGNPVCLPAEKVVTQSIYLAGGFPVFAGKKLFWDLPRAVLLRDESRPRPAGGGI